MQSSSLVHHPQHCFNITLRQAMRTKINVILQRTITFTTTDATRKQMMFSQYTNYLETELMKLAKSEEEYSNSRDLEVRIHYLRKEYEESRRVMRVSHGISAVPDSLITQILLWLPTKDSVKTSILSTRWRIHHQCQVPIHHQCYGS